MVIYPPCKHCGASHGMGVEEMTTGQITPIDICHTCLWKDLEFMPIKDQVVLEEDMESILRDLEKRLTI